MRCRFSALLAVAFALGCQKVAPAPARPAPAPEAPKVVGAAPIGTPSFVAASSGHSDPECVGPLDFAVPETISIGGHPAKLDGYRLTLEAPPQGPVALGVLANLNDPSPENSKAIDAYLEFFKTKGVQAIVVDGDSGDGAEAIQGVLEPIAKSGLPVLVLIGNREPKGGFIDALDALRKDHPNVFNLSRVREVDLGPVSLLSLPGYHDPRYLLAGQDGCLYHAEDLKALRKVASQLKSSVVLVSHGPPHGEGPRALDRVQNPPGNVGDPKLAELITDAHIPFGIFANIIEAGGQATSLSGDRTIPQGSWESELYLDPGAADTVPWSMNDGSHARGMAAVMSFKNGKASYEILRLASAEKAEAKR